MVTASITPPRHHYPCCSIYQKALNQGALFEGIGKDMGKHVFKGTEGNLLCEINRNECTLAGSVRLDAFYKKKAITFNCSE
ncbi:MAG: hypothetical protein ABJE79_11695 [Marinomonas sp.]